MNVDYLHLPVASERKLVNDWS